MKRKLVILIGALFLALAVSVGTYAYTFSVATATLNATPAGADIVTIEEASETSQPDWDSVLPHPGYNLEIIVPNAAGDETNIPFQSPDDGEHWDKVDEATADDQDTVVFTRNSPHYQRDLYQLTDHIQGSGDIAMVTVYFRFAGFSDGHDRKAYARAIIKTNGSVYESPVETTAGSTFVTRSFQWTVNPSTGAAWTWEEIDALQAGVSLKGQSPTRPAYCTQVYVAVGYETPPIIDGAVPKGDLFTVTPHPAYTGDLMFNIYLTNTGNLNLAYRHLNMKIYVADSIEAGETPHYQVLSLENGVAIFNIEGGAAESYTVKVIGGGYNLTSGDPNEWGDGWSITPEFYCEVNQR